MKLIIFKKSSLKDNDLLARKTKISYKKLFDEIQHSGIQNNSLL